MAASIIRHWFSIWLPICIWFQVFRCVFKDIWKMKKNTNSKSHDRYNHSKGIQEQFMLIHCTSCSCQVKNMIFVWQAFYLSDFNFPLPALDFLLQFIQIGFFCDIFHDFWYAKICQLLPQLPVNFLSLCPLLQNEKSPWENCKTLYYYDIN